jgi:hypothetical protein
VLSFALRIPAANLYCLLAREKTGAANEFSTIKNLESPNSWVAVPVVYPQFMTIKREHDDRVHSVRDPELWREALGWTLVPSGAVMPPIPRYETFPWVASVGMTDPLKLTMVFDDRYFMASSELNLLNTLLLAEAHQTDKAG